MKKFMSFANRQRAAILIFACILLAISCSDDDDTPGAPEVTSIIPLTGPKATVVTIEGTNFSTSLMESEVTFNGKPGIITSATPTQLTVIVPPAANSGPVIVNSKGKTATNQPTFNFQWTVSTVAGSTGGYENGSNAKFNIPSGIVADAQGNLYVTDWWNSVIRKITPEGITSAWAGGTPGAVDGTGENARFWGPNGCAIDNNGNVYVSDESNCQVRKITPTRNVTTLAGILKAKDFADGAGAAAKFNIPSGIAIDKDGILYVADQLNHRIRKVNPEGAVTTLAGSTQGFEDGIGATAQFFRPVGLVVDATGTVYVGDLFNHRIRKITASGVVTTIAGSSYGFNNGAGTAAQFAYPAGLALDKLGNLYVADTENHRIRKITPEGVVTTFAGTSQGSADGLATTSQFYLPREIDIDNAGVMYVADAGNNRIRKID